MSKPTICIDAGHYGKYNMSPCNKKYYESEMVWKLHNYLKEKLIKYGFNVITTRQKQETDLGLNARGMKAKSCDLFISIHSNAVGSGINNSVDYPVSYVSVDGSADVIGLKLAQCVKKVMDLKQNARIEKRVSEKDKDGDGKLNDDYYGVLVGCDNVNVPGIILEHSFHTNSKTTEWLLKDSNLEKLAEEEAKTLAEYYDLDHEIVPSKRITTKSSMNDVSWLQSKLQIANKEILEYIPLKTTGVYDDATRLHLLIYWYKKGWGKHMNDDGKIAGISTINELKRE